MDTHIFSATGPTNAPTRVFISSAALLVNVMARISNGLMPWSLDQVGDAVREHPRLARSGPGDDEQRPVVMGHGLPLDGVQAVEDVLWVVASRPARSPNSTDGVCHLPSSLG